MMLSRVADALYWLGRYVERAENVARFLMVTAELSVEMEGLDEELARAEWRELLEVFGCPPPETSGADAGSDVAPEVAWMLLSPENPSSVYASLEKARENARSVREALTREVFSNLNEAFHDLDRVRRKGWRGSLADPGVSRTHTAILTTLGAMELTLSRDEGWSFLKLGEAIERTQRVLQVLQVKLPGLLGDSELAAPLLYARWRSLLRGVASLENYRRACSGSLEPERVVSFLLLDPHAPRTIRCGLSRMQAYLERVSPPGPRRTAARIVRRLLTDLEDAEDESVGALEAVRSCETMAKQLWSAHEALERDFFPN